MKFGKASFNPLAFKDTSKSDFKKTYGGKVSDEDLEAAWKAIQKALPKKSKRNGPGETDK